jgi:hypothetical protein
MKTNRKISKVASLIAVAAALIATAPGTLAAAQPFISHVDFSYETTSFCGFPIIVHFTSTQIERFNPSTGQFTYIFNSRIEYSNPANGKTVTGIGAGPFYIKDDGTEVYDGLFMIHTPDGTVVDAGIEEIGFVYDPETGTGQFVTTSHLGTDASTSDIWAAVCAALQ